MRRTKLAVLAALTLPAVSMPVAAAASVLVVRSSGPSAGTYPPGKALPDSHLLRLKATDLIVLLDSRGTRTLSGPGNFSVLASAAPSARGGVTGTTARRARLGAVRGVQPRSVWQADLAHSGNVCVANPADLGLWRPDSSGEAHVTLTGNGGANAAVHFAKDQNIAAWPKGLAVTDGTTVSVYGLGPTTRMTVKVLGSVPSSLEGMAQSLIRANCESQLDVLIDTFSVRPGG